jgi:type VI secretion system secreted protein VgrG
MAPNLVDTTDDGRLLSVITPLGKDVLLVNRFSATERISRPFDFDLEVMTPLAKAKQVSATALIGRPICVNLNLGDGKFRRFNGIVNRFVEGDQDFNFRYYQIEMVPRLWLLTLMADCRIFQNVAAPDIIKQVLTAHGFAEDRGDPANPGDFRLLLSRTYTKWDYCVQYRETAFNFVTRIMEQEGIYYFHEHSENQHTLVIADNLQSSTVCVDQPRVSFILAASLGEGLSGMTSWQKTQSLAPGLYTVRDYHFQVPSKTLERNSPTTFPEGGNQDFEVYDFPGEYAEKFKDSARVKTGAEPSLETEAQTVARLRMQAEETPQDLFSGSSDRRGFEVGHFFDLEEHPSLAGRYVITSLQHSAVQSPAHTPGREFGVPYSNAMSCMLSTRIFRPPRIAIRPTVQGPQTAVVVGQDSPKDGSDPQEILTDEYGRVKVQFHWDRVGQKDQHSSAFVRVAQIWAGNSWGAIFIPRVGQEVIVDFLEGDPDEPIIIGSVYNAEKLPPYSLPASRTQSGIKTRSSPKGGSENYNEIRFEDKKGSEDLLIHAERTMHNSVEASQIITVGGDRHITTGGVDKDGNKSGDVKELVFKNHNLHVKTDDRIKIEGDSHLHVQGKADATYDSDLVQGITGKCVIIADSIQLQGKTKLELIVGGSSIVIDASGVTVLGTPLINLNSPGAPPVPEIIPLTVDPDDP